MNFREITLFSFKKISASALYFIKFIKSVENFPYKLEHGAYESTENLNRGYNYLLKITSDSSETFCIEFKNKYQLFLKEIALLNEKEIFTLAYKPLQQCVNEKNLQEKPKINHVVFFEFNESCTNKNIDEVFHKLIILLPSVEGALSFCYGERLNASPLAKEYVFEMQFLNVSARDKYLKQKEHEEVVEFIIPLLKNREASVIAFDYEFSMEKCEGQNNLIASKLFLASTDSAGTAAEPLKTEQRQIQGYRT